MLKEGHVHAFALGWQTLDFFNANSFMTMTKNKKDFVNTKYKHVLEVRPSNRCFNK